MLSRYSLWMVAGIGLLSASALSAAGEKSPQPMFGEGNGLIGHAVSDGRDLGVVFRYTHDKVVQPKVLANTLEFEGQPESTIDVRLRGQVEAPRAMKVKFWHAGGSSSRGWCTLLVDGEKIGRVGDDMGKNFVYELDLAKGPHQIEWSLTGGHFGCALLKVTDAETDELLPLSYKPDHAKGLPDVKEEDFVELNSDKRGWPIRNGW